MVNEMRSVINASVFLVVCTLLSSCGRLEHTVNELKLKWSSPDPDDVTPEILSTVDYNLQIAPLATSLYLPWAIEFLPDDSLLVTEKNGSLILINLETGDQDEIRGVPDTQIWGQGGLMDVVTHPDFSINSYLYLAFAAPVPGNEVVTRVVRATLEGFRLVDHIELFSALPASVEGYHFGSALTFDDDGFLYITSGERGVRGPVQDLDNSLGKVIRLHDDGSVPADNPFVDDESALPEIFTLGHRNPQAILIEPETREVWAIEHGPRGGDEVNRLVAGGNYGWPVVGYGLEYDEDVPVAEATSRPGIEEPLYYYDPSIATSGATFYTGDVFEEWRGDLFIGGLGRQLVSRLDVENGQIVGREDFDFPGRVRDIEEGPDGLLYVLTDEGMLYRVSPVE